MAEVMIRCHLCNGTGRLILTGEYLTTFIQLAEVKGETTGAELAKAMKTKATAMNNRLAALERHGLAVSRRWGRKRLYKAAQLVGGANP